MTHGKPTVPMRRLLVAPLAATVVTALAASPASGADSMRCHRPIEQSVESDALIVPDGATCTIEPGAHVKLSGSVEVRPRGTLQMLRRNGVRGVLSVGRDVRIEKGARLQDTGRLSVAGNVTATGTGAVYAYDETSIRGNVEISAYTTIIELGRIDVRGTLSIQHSATGPGFGSVAVTYSHLGGLVLKHNATGANIAGNHIANRLECAHNDFHALYFAGNSLAGRPLPDHHCTTKR